MGHLHFLQNHPSYPPTLVRLRFAPIYRHRLPSDKVVANNALAYSLPSEIISEVVGYLSTHRLGNMPIEQEKGDPKIPLNILHTLSQNYRHSLLSRYPDSEYATTHTYSP